MRSESSPTCPTRRLDDEAIAAAVARQSARYQPPGTLETAAALTAGRGQRSEVREQGQKSESSIPR